MSSESIKANKYTYIAYLAIIQVLHAEISLQSTLKYLSILKCGVLKPHNLLKQMNIKASDAKLAGNQNKQVSTL